MKGDFLNWFCERFNLEHDTGGYLIRFLWFIVPFCFCLGAIVYNYGALMITDKGKEEVAKRQPPVERGSIVDRKGQLLAVDTRLSKISLIREEIFTKEENSKEMKLDEQLCRDIAKVLSPLINASESSIVGAIKTSPTSYVVIKKKLDKSASQRVQAAKSGKADPVELQIIEDNYIGIDNPKAKTAEIEAAVARARERRKILQKVRLEPISGRIYPEGTLASQMIGIVGDNNMGQEGIEYGFNDRLSPRADAAGNMISGDQVILTIDVQVQHILEQIAKDTLIENKAESIMLAAMDPHTGEILGSASLPDFNPNNYLAYPSTTWRYNPALYNYEPGSVFKVFAIASMLDAGAITENSTFVCNGHYDKVSPAITDLQVHGKVTAERILAYSCNVGISYASELIGSDVFYQKLYGLGFGQRIGSGSPSERPGIFAAATQWGRRTKPTIAMGHEISVSMLQMLQAATAIANNGMLVQPRLISGFRTSEGVLEPFTAKEPRPVLKAKTAADVLRFMRAVVTTDGTGWRAAIGDIPMAVKTGTAQMIDEGTGRYSDTNFIASCMAILPADKPSLILYVVIVNPHGESYLGGRIATIPIRKAAETLVDYLGILRGKHLQIDHSGSVTYPMAADTPALENTMPDFTGYSKQSLIPLLLQSDFPVEIQGNGHVKRQSPLPGTLLVHGDTLTFYLE